MNGKKAKLLRKIKAGTNVNIKYVKIFYKSLPWKLREFITNMESLVKLTVKVKT